MKPVKIFLFSACLLAPLLMAGCGGQKYVEQPTAPGQVALPVAVQPAQPYRNPTASMQPAQPYRNPNAGARAITPTGNEAPPAKEPQPLFNSGTVMNGFRTAYQQKGAPRIAIFLNRSLSDEVREWSTPIRAVLSREGTFTSTTDSGEQTVSGPGGVAAYNQYHNTTSARDNVGEGWMWRFEEGFLQPFIDVGAAIVDRATIMRLTAAATGQQGSKFDALAVKKVEMDALTGKADLFIEILIRRSSMSKMGYEFKASAKEVQTGIIRANVTSIDWKYDVEPETEEIVAHNEPVQGYDSQSGSYAKSGSQAGYVIKETGGEEQFPEMNIVARDLAMALMRSLSNSWQQ